MLKAESKKSSLIFTLSLLLTLFNLFFNICTFYKA
jgi:hypothetical protein